MAKKTWPTKEDQQLDDLLEHQIKREQARHKKPKKEEDAKEPR